jgi:hypothetical protein
MRLLWLLSETALCETVRAENIVSFSPMIK